MEYNDDSRMILEIMSFSPHLLLLPLYADVDVDSIIGSAPSIRLKKIYLQLQALPDD